MPEFALPKSRSRLRTVLAVVLKIGGLTLIASACSVFFGWATARVRIDKRLKAAIEVADKDDPHWRLNDLLAHRIPIPEDKNAGKLILELAKAPLDAWDPRPTPAFGGPKSERRKLGEAIDALGTGKLYAPPDPAAIAVIQESLANLGPILRKARELARYSQGANRLVFRYNPLATPLTETQASGSVARILWADAIVRAESGDPEGAIESCIAGVNCGRAIGDEPLFISQFVRTANVFLALNAVHRVLCVSSPSAPGLANLQALLEDEIRQPTLLYGVKGERAQLDDLLEKMANGTLDLDVTESQSTGIAGGFSISGPFRQNIGREARATALEFMNDAVRIARKPLRERAADWAAYDAAFEACEQKKLFDAQGERIATLLVPPLEQVRNSDTFRQVLIGATITLVAAERHRIKTGRWPESIGAIDKSILTEPPIDPFSGKPILTVARGGKFFAYSVSFNGIDDHAAFAAKPRTPGPYDDGWFALDVELRGKPPAASQETK